MALRETRGKQHEKQYEKDSEFQFKVGVRRNKLVGLWAAEKLGLAGDAAEAYAKEVIKADFEEVGDEDVIRKLAQDFSTKGVAVGDAEIRAQLAKAEETATDQLEAEQKGGS